MVRTAGLSGNNEVLQQMSERVQRSWREESVPPQGTKFCGYVAVYNTYAMRT